jgi:hypothetical protein
MHDERKKNDKRHYAPADAGVYDLQQPEQKEQQK